jgi:hypothetical protein
LRPLLRVGRRREQEARENANYRRREASHGGEDTIGLSEIEYLFIASDHCLIDSSICSSKGE